MKPIVSIIIPCYKTEKTLSETLQSVLDQNFNEWEALIINDGSPDNLEAIAIEWMQKEARFKYFKKDNGGLGSARNYGIHHAIGEYVLPLDSDNKIRPDFVKNALKVFQSKSNIGVVYGDAMRFGEEHSIWNVGDFDLYRILEHNYIDACTLIRKAVFDLVGGYDENMPFQGHEDWDFWLSVVGSPYEFYYLKEITFDYRVTSTSMIHSFNLEMISQNVSYIQKKHYELYVNSFLELYKLQSELKQDKLSNYTTKHLLQVVWFRIRKRLWG